LLRVLTAKSVEGVKGESQLLVELEVRETQVSV
jgi:hypothetical protein